MEQGRSPSEVDELLRRVSELTRLVQEQQATIAAQHERLERAQEQITLLKSALFSPRRERYQPSADQQLLFAPEAISGSAPREEETPPSDEEPPPATRPSRRGRRFTFPQGLPHERVEHPLPPAERPCACCGQDRVAIREHVTKQLELKPAQAYVVEHVRYTYACSKCRDGSQVMTTAKPSPPIEKSPFGPSVLAWLVSAKFERHLTLYRGQEILLEPLGQWLSRPLLCKLLKGTARALAPLAERLLAEILRSYVVQADETPVRYLGAAAGKSSQGYLYGYGGDGEHRFVWYDFRPSRNRDGPRQVLAPYRGVLQTDGYVIYRSLVNESQGRLIAAACWMHARRGFDEARLTTSHPAVEESLALIQRLYDIEDRAKAGSFEQRRTLRGRESAPLLERLFARWHEVRPQLRPSMKLAEAIDYALDRREALTRFFDDGRIELDTGHLERSLRPAAIGRRNWLFFGSLSGGRTGAVLYSIVQSARQHLLDVTAYLTDVLNRLPEFSPADGERLAELLPDRWAKTHPQHVLIARREESRSAQLRRRARRAARRFAAGS